MMQPTSTFGPRAARGAALAAALCAACGGRDAPETGTPSAGAPGAQSGAALASAAGGASAASELALRAASNAGTFVAEVTPLGGAVPMNEPFAVELRLFEPDGVTPFEPESVTLDARMEEHEHGMLRDVELARLGPGRWQADGLLFHMVGLWQFQIDVRQGARIERAQLDLRLR